MIFLIFKRVKFCGLEVMLKKSSGLFGLIGSRFLNVDSSNLFLNGMKLVGFLLFEWNCLILVMSVIWMVVNMIGFLRKNGWLVSSSRNILSVFV